MTQEQRERLKRTLEEESSLHDHGTVIYDKLSIADALDLLAENQRMRELLTKAHTVISDTRFERGDTNKQIKSFLAETK